MSAAALLAALLVLYPHTPARRCIDRNASRIAAVVAVGDAEYGVPPAVMLAIGFFETHLGCDLGEGGNWGAPVDVRHRHTAGTPMHAVRALARSYAVCGSWAGAVGRFRSGLCRPWQPDHRRYVRSVLRLAARLDGAVPDSE